MNIFGVDTDKYQATQDMLKEAAKTGDSLRLFEDEATGLLDVIKLSLSSWLMIYATGKRIDAYADDPTRFQHLMRTMMNDLDNTQMVYLNPGDVKYILEAQEVLVDRICIAKFGMDLKGVEAMYAKIGDAFGKGFGGQIDE